MPFWIHLLLAPMAVVFFISVLAETNRLPFDLPKLNQNLWQVIMLSIHQ